MKYYPVDLKPGMCGYPSNNVLDFVISVVSTHDDSIYLLTILEIDIVTGAPTTFTYSWPANMAFWTSKTVVL